MNTYEATELAYKNGYEQGKKDAREENGKPLAEYLHPIENYAGLKGKYLVFKEDTGERVENCFVLRPDKDNAAVEALRTYAKATENKTLSNDIYNWVGEGKKDALKWIPVSERLPDSERIVLVCAITKYFKHRHILMAAHIGHHEFTTEDNGWQEYEGDTEYDEENDCFWIPECWYEVNAVEDSGNWIIDSDYDVTHWMPLPEPPKKDNVDRCICCGEIIPEGRQVCIKCERGGGNGKT